jgi:hypothetical protein
MYTGEFAPTFHRERVRTLRRTHGAHRRPRVADQLTDRDTAGTTGEGQAWS